MDDIQWTRFAGQALSPLGAVFFLYIAKKIAPWLMRMIPEGKVRRLLLVRLNKSGS